MELVTATADRGDRDALLALLRAQLDEHDIALPDVALARAVDGVLDDAARGLFIVAREGHGQPVRGVAYLALTWSLEHGGRSAWLEELYVYPAWRDKGIGRALVRAVVERATALGCAAVDLEVETAHTRAAHLYEREGFRAHQRARWVRVLGS